MKTIDMRLTADLTALSPISIVPPNSGFEDLLDNEGKKAGKVFKVARHKVRNPDSGKIEYRPVITASTIRGKLRRAAARICLATSERRPGLKAYLYTTVGDIKGKKVKGEKEETYSINERNERRGRNPVVALFGASVPFDSSRALVEHAVPLGDIEHVEPYTVGGTRTDDFVRNADITELVDNSFLQDYLTKRENTKATSQAKQEAKAAKANLAKAYETRDEAKIEKARSELSKAQGALDEAQQKSGNSLMLPHAHQAIPAGTPFAQQTILSRVTEAEAGLFLLAIANAFALDPTFGGKRNLNYGQVSGSWAVEIRESDDPDAKWTRVGSFEAEPYEPIEFDPVFEPYIKAWNEYVESGVMNLLVDGTGDTSDDLLPTDASESEEGESKPAAKAKKTKAAA